MSIRKDSVARILPNLARFKPQLVTVPSQEEEQKRRSIWRKVLEVFRGRYSSLERAETVPTPEDSKNEPNPQPSESEPSLGPQVQLETEPKARHEPELAQGTPPAGEPE